MLGVNIEAALSKFVVFPPIEFTGAVAEVDGACLALERSDYFTSRIALRLVVSRFWNNRCNVTRLPVSLSTRDDHADRPLVHFLLQLRKIACLPPAETRAEITQPTAQIIRALFVDRD